jgi:hypothetical protein
MSLEVYRYRNKTYQNLIAIGELDYPLEAVSKYIEGARDE